MFEDGWVEETGLLITEYNMKSVFKLYNIYGRIFSICAFAALTDRKLFFPDKSSASANT